MVRVVIIGAGFAGLSAAKVLADKENIQVTIIDRCNHHLFQPLLYQVATASLSPADIAEPIRGEFSHCKNVEVVLNEVTSISLADRSVICDERSYEFDYLIVAAGVTHSYFGHDEWEKFAPGLKNLADATEIRRKILGSFEHAENCRRCPQCRQCTNFIVIGGGPTGVEMAGSLAELTFKTLKDEFRYVDTNKSRITLIEGGTRILPSFAENLSDKARSELERRGVAVVTHSPVTLIDADGVVAGGVRYDAGTVIWAAGVQASPVAKMLGTPLHASGKVLVNNYLTVKDFDNVFAVGDIAFMTNQKGEVISGVSPAALQSGRCAAQNILRKIERKNSVKFKYFDKGSMATVGRSFAIASIAGVQVSGFIAWLLWVFVHIAFLIGFRNRVLVLVQWAWAYFTFERHSRILIPKYKVGRR